MQTQATVHKSSTVGRVLRSIYENEQHGAWVEGVKVQKERKVMAGEN